MIRSGQVSFAPPVERKTLRRRVHQLWKWFNCERWDKCYALIDPQLHERAKVRFEAYAEGLRSFKACYESIRPWYVRISLHLDASTNKHDPRPFAYVYIVWQDAANEFHMFRERWVKEKNRWFTRVVGLVPNQPTVVRGRA